MIFGYYHKCCFSMEIVHNCFLSMILPGKNPVSLLDYLNKFSYFQALQNIPLNQPYSISSESQKILVMVKYYGGWLTRAFLFCVLEFTILFSCQDVSGQLCPRI